MSKGNESTFVTFLGLLNVKHTQAFSNRFFNEHPHKYNLYGLSKMLSDYGIENAGTQIEDKEKDLFNIELPFIAHTGSDFAVVNKIEPDKVHYFWNGEKIAVSISQFISAWSGIVLLAETTAASIEPDYREHRKKELFGIAQKILLALAGILIFGLIYIHHSLFTDLGISLLLTFNLIGVYICYLLVLKQMRIHSQYVDKICSLFSKSDCNNVLESDAAKLWGVFGWSEIGLGYFVSNVLLLLFAPQTISILVIVNILALPYCFWSVWYQKTKARQWCPLCLIVLSLLWGIFILNCLFGYIQTPVFDSAGLQIALLTGCTYAILVFGFNLFVPSLSKGGEVEKARQEINAIKANEEVFKTLLFKQPHYEIDITDSQIIFGNPDAGLKITILTNPFCNPCAKMHARVEKLLNDTKEDVCIQYVFSSFTHELDYANKSMIAVYLKSGKDTAVQLYGDWFMQGKALRERFFENLGLDMSGADIETEFQKHEAWKAKTQIRATPTILVNGYKLPDNYKIEDLRFLRNLMLTIK